LPAQPPHASILRGFDGGHQSGAGAAVVALESAPVRDVADPGGDQQAALGSHGRQADFDRELCAVLVEIAPHQAQPRRGYKRGEVMAVMRTDSSGTNTSIDLPTKYALDCELIGKSPKIGMYKVERPEIQPWDYEQYARMLHAAKIEGAMWYVAVCLAGEAGLRVGEVKALRWREDVDLVAKTITVNQQTCYGVTTTPKGRTR
jgi:hypothetical protein